MKLRWFTTYDENGVDSPTELQYWDGEQWQDVHHVRVKESETESFMKNKSATMW